MTAQIGINVTAVRTSTEGPEYAVGTRCRVDALDGTGEKEFVYVNANEAITAAGYLCQIDTAFGVQMVDTTSSAPGTGVGKAVGAAMAAIALEGFGWLQVLGKGSVRTLASAAVGTSLNSTATPGAVDDDATSGAERIVGLSLGTATGGAEATNADAYFNYPSIGLTI